jgi:DnaJ domain
MAAADMATWRRQNSDTHAVEILLVDGTALNGTLLISRDKTMREFFNIGTDAFIDFECRLNGPLVLAKASIQRIRPEGAQKKDDQAKVDALAARQAELEKTDIYKILGVPTSITKDDLRKAYHIKARQYHPDKFVDPEIPAEIRDYVNAMARRVNSAYQELTDVLAAADKRR